MKYNIQSIKGKGIFPVFIKKKAILNATILSAAVVLFTGAANAEEVSDPFEGVNRAVFSFNKVVDDNVIYPVLDGYRIVVPSFIRTGLKNFMRNLKSPVVFANQLLQGDIAGAGDVFVRTSVNTFVGFGGVFDFAADEGIEYEHEDFGQTMAVWGVPHGAYVVVPLIGPTTARDGAGFLVDMLADPLRITWNNQGHDTRNNWRLGSNYLMIRDKLMNVMQSLEYGSIDYYATVRSGYTQARAAQVSDKSEDEALFVEMADFDDDDL